MENELLQVIMQNMPGLAALLYIIFFQGKEIKAKRTENDSLRAENDKLRLKNEALYLRIIEHFESAASGRVVSISKPPGTNYGKEN